MSFPLQHTERRFHAVARGRIPGVYKSLSDVYKQIEGWNGARWGTFSSLEDAELFVKNGEVTDFLYPMEQVQYVYHCATCDQILEGKYALDDHHCNPFLRNSPIRTVIRTPKPDGYETKIIEQNTQNVGNLQIKKLKASPSRGRSSPLVKSDGNILNWPASSPPSKKQTEDDQFWYYNNHYNNNNWSHYYYDDYR